MLVNHETGAASGTGYRVPGIAKDSSPIPDTRYPIPAVHTDAAQAVGKIAVDFHALGVTALTVSAHKFGGPPGVGALLLHRGAKLRPLFHGGHQQQGHRPGTEPVALAVGMATALEVAVRDLEANTAHARRLRDRLLDRLRAEASPVVLNGPADTARAVPHILNVSFPGCAADGLLIALDLAGVACSTGSACSSGSLLPSPVLQAMGVPDDVLRSAMRFSFGPQTTEAEIDEAARRIVAVVRRLREVEQADRSPAAPSSSG
jgi:cysteine desulfurase